MALLGLAALLVSGVSITVSLLYCKRLHDHGVNAEVVTSTRYMLLILIAAGVCWHNGGLGGIDTVSEAAILTGLATLLIVLPLYAFQVGIALTTPLTANVLRALGPVFVFALEQSRRTAQLLRADAHLHPGLFGRSDPKQRGACPVAVRRQARAAEASVASAHAACRCDGCRPGVKLTTLPAHAAPPGWP